ncbi:unnamed protein product [Urochloa decumbens]|uniref:Methyltransferase domain-containing protein n=1 Tax=Urochloa decumbens TaxID=240449 RepID=A0ABC8ZU20_9POAL
MSHLVRSILYGIHNSKILLELVNIPMTDYIRQMQCSTSQHCISIWPLDLAFQGNSPQYGKNNAFFYPYLNFTSVLSSFSGNMLIVIFYWRFGCYKLCSPPICGIRCQNLLSSLPLLSNYFLNFRQSFFAVIFPFKRCKYKLFGTEVMDVRVGWTKNLCSSKDLPSCSVLDIGTGSGRLLQQLAKQGFSDLTGIDYSEGAIELARNLAIHDGFEHINFLVDDVLESKLERRFELVMDEGTLDAIGLHPDGPVKRMMYWQSVASLVSPGGILVITSCSRTKDELVQEVENFNQRKLGAMGSEGLPASDAAVFSYLDHVRSYPSVDSSCITTVAFLHK